VLRHENHVLRTGQEDRRQYIAPHELLHLTLLHGELHVDLVLF
jgi:hypothetical protein